MITSRSNSQFKLWLSLLEPKGIKKQGRFLLFGEQQIRELQSTQPDLIKQIIEKGDLSSELFRELDVFGTNSSIAVCTAPNFEAWDPSAQNQGTTLLCPCGDPGNLGNIIRSCSAFAVDQLVLLEEACNPLHPKVVRAASGTLFHTKILRGPRLNDLEYHWQKNWFALDMHGDNLIDHDWPENPVLLIGEEGPGLPVPLKKNTLRIPMSENCESLNASTATAIALASLYNKTVK